MLAGKGILEPTGSKGLKVVSFSNEQALDVREVRLALESVAIRKAMKLAAEDDQLLKPLMLILKEMARLSARSSSAIGPCTM